MDKSELQIKLAEAQLTGYADASRGSSIEDHADSMGLTKKEWITLKKRGMVFLRPLDVKSLDEKFGIK